MKIDHAYLKGLLEAFEDAEAPFTDVLQLRKQGYACEEDAFVFHFHILIDKGLIEAKSLDGSTGYQIQPNGSPLWMAVPLRLTASGHEYISSLHEPDVWETIQKNFRESSLDTVKSIATDLAKKYAKKKLEELLG